VRHGRRSWELDELKSMTRGNFAIQEGEVPYIRKLVGFRTERESLGSRIEEIRVAQSLNSRFRKIFTAQVLQIK